MSYYDYMTITYELCWPMYTKTVFNFRGRPYLCFLWEQYTGFSIVVWLSISGNVYQQPVNFPLNLLFVR